MSNSTERDRPRQAAVLSYAFRPMFLAAALWAIVALGLWLAQFLGYLQLPTRFDPLAWHLHEMLFGFVLAAAAGFLLTAIPNWTGRLPVRGGPLAALAALWLLGRAATLVSALLPAWLAVAADLAFPLVLFAVAAREVAVGRNWRNLPTLAPVAVLVAADLLMHLEALAVPVPGGLGWRLGMAAPLLLIAVIGGRIVPSFTRNWLAKRKSPRLPAPQGLVDKAALGLLAPALLLWAALPGSPASAGLLLLAALAQAWRLSRWTGLATWAEPLLFILHLGYAWLAAGLALLGLSILTEAVPPSAALHALTAGAITVMILAVMPRVTLGHTGRALTAGRTTLAAFLLINAAALARVGAAWLPEFLIELLALAAACWIAAFGLFLLVYGPMLLTRRPSEAGRAA